MTWLGPDFQTIIPLGIPTLISMKLCLCTIFPTFIIGEKYRPNYYTYNFSVHEVQEGERLFAVASYIAENEDSINLAEGERVYIIGKKICRKWTYLDTYGFESGGSSIFPMHEFRMPLPNNALLKLK